LPVGTPPDPTSPGSEDDAMLAAGLATRGIAGVYRGEGRGEEGGREGSSMAEEDGWAELERRIRRGEEAERMVEELRRANCELSDALALAKEANHAWGEEEEDGVRGRGGSNEQRLKDELIRERRARRAAEDKARSIKQSMARQSETLRVLQSNREGTAERHGNTLVASRRMEQGMAVLRASLAREELANRALQVRSVSSQWLV